MAKTPDKEISVNLIQSIKDKSDDDYEKNVTYISAGTLVLSLTFLEKIVKLETSTGISFLIASWVLMGLTLGINLLSHQLSSLFAEKSYDENAEQKFEAKVIVANIRSRNKVIRILNFVTTATLFLGMATLIIFCSINALTPKTTVMPEKAIINTDSLEQKGRTVPVHSSLINAAAKESAPKQTDSTGSSQQNNTSSQNEKK
ncbi:hypothetical protein [Dyadobacter sp. 32]|uniref:hypothetical protein n=1 Tax=Dyadobacter sp. 32 TaxID=538966 RepID=UPI0011EF8A36